jgi:glycosyltransferase involved in cell wall biosynthesis
MLRLWVAKDYLKQIKKLSKTNQKLTIIVMDDLHLLEAIASLKRRLKTPITLIFSFHGFRLQLAQKLQKQVDKVLFLTHLGYQESKAVSGGFLPKVCVVGNAVDSAKFYPPTRGQKDTLRATLGIANSDKVFVWMANDRPIKGLEMFRRIAQHYAAKNFNYKFLVIGNSTAYEDNFCTYCGKIPNDKIASYLQVGNFYLFTALTQEGFGLSVIEAYKCGNFVIAPQTGAIPETLENLVNCAFVSDPSNFNEWIDIIDEVLDKEIDQVSLSTSNQIWPYKVWEQKFLNAITSES